MERANEVSFAGSGGNASCAPLPYFTKIHLWEARSGEGLVRKCQSRCFLGERDSFIGGAVSRQLLKSLKSTAPI